MSSDRRHLDLLCSVVLRRPTSLVLGIYINFADDRGSLEAFYRRCARFGYYNNDITTESVGLAVF